MIVTIRKKICTSPSSMVAPQSPRGFEKSDWPTPIQTSYFIGPYNLHCLLFSGIGALLCHHPYCFPSQSQTLFGIGAGRPPITAVARWKYLRLCWRGGWGGGVDVVVLFIFLTFWIFILLLVARYCVTLFSDTEMIYQKIDNAVTKVMPLSARRWWWQKQQRFKTKKVFLSVKFSHKAAF